MNVQKVDLHNTLYVLLEAFLMGFFAYRFNTSPHEELFTMAKKLGDFPTILMENPPIILNSVLVEIMQ